MNSREYDLLRALGLQGDPHEDEDLRIIHEHLRRVAEEAQQERDELRAGLMIPGEQRCVECGFALHKLVLRAADGMVGVPTTAPLEDCPNGHGIMIGVTYEQGWREMVRESSAAHARAEVLNDKLDKAESDLAAAREQLTETHRQVGLANQALADFRERDQRQYRQIEAAREQVRRLSKALQRYERDGECDYGGPDEQCPGSPAFTPCRWHQARAALSETAQPVEEK